MINLSLVHNLTNQLKWDRTITSFGRKIMNLESQKNGGLHIYAITKEVIQSIWTQMDL